MTTDESSNSTNEQEMVKSKNRENYQDLKLQKYDKNKYNKISESVIDRRIMNKQGPLQIDNQVKSNNVNTIQKVDKREESNKIMFAAPIHLIQKNNDTIGIDSDCDNSSQGNNSEWNENIQISITSRRKSNLSNSDKIGNQVTNRLNKNQINNQEINQTNELDIDQIDNLDVKLIDEEIEFGSILLQTDLDPIEQENDQRNGKLYMRQLNNNVTTNSVGSQENNLINSKLYKQQLDNHINTKIVVPIDGYDNINNLYSIQAYPHHIFSNSNDDTMIPEKMYNFCSCHVTHNTDNYRMIPQTVYNFYSHNIANNSHTDKMIPQTVYDLYPHNSVNNRQFDSMIPESVRNSNNDEIRLKYNMKEEIGSRYDMNKYKNQYSSDKLLNLNNNLNHINNNNLENNGIQSNYNGVQYDDANVYQHINYPIHNRQVQKCINKEEQSYNNKLKEHRYQDYSLENYENHIPGKKVSYLMKKKLTYLKLPILINDDCPETDHIHQNDTSDETNKDNNIRLYNIDNDFDISNKNICYIDNNNYVYLYNTNNEIDLNRIDYNTTLDKSNNYTNLKYRNQLKNQQLNKKNRSSYLDYPDDKKNNKNATKNEKSNINHQSEMKTRISIKNDQIDIENDKNVIKKNKNIHFSGGSSNNSHLVGKTKKNILETGINDQILNNLDQALFKRVEKYLRNKSNSEQGSNSEINTKSDRKVIDKCDHFNIKKSIQKTNIINKIDKPIYFKSAYPVSRDTSIESNSNIALLRK